MSVFSPLTRLRRRDTLLLFGAIVLVAAVVVYNEIIVTNSWIRNTGLKAYSVGDIWKKSMSDNWVGKAQQPWEQKSLTEDKLQSLLDKLASIGVESKSDLQFIKEEDLPANIPPIQFQRLLNAWQT